VAPVARAREGIAYLTIDVEGYARRAIADLLGVGTPSVYNAAQRGRAASSQWDQLVGRKANKEATSRIRDVPKGFGDVRRMSRTPCAHTGI